MTKLKLERWVFEGLKGDSLIHDIADEHISIVRDLWRYDECAWDRGCVCDLYGDYLGDRICDISILCNGPANRIIWFHANKEIYPTKFGYSWLIFRKMGFDPHKCFWRAIWKLSIPPKVHIFAWRIGHNILPKNLKIAAINHSFSCTCPKCGGVEELLIHGLRDCVKAWVILIFGGIDGRLLDSEWDSGIDLLENTMRLLDVRAFESLIMLLWNIWNGRNNLIFCGKDDDPMLIWERAKAFGEDFRIHNFSNVVMIPKPARSVKWSKPL